MTSGPPRPFVSVKFTPAGRTQTFCCRISLSMRPDPTSPYTGRPPRLGPGDAVVVPTPRVRLSLQ